MSGQPNGILPDGHKPELPETLSFAERMKAQLAAANDRTQKFYIPSTAPNPDLRFVVELNNSVKDQDDMERLAGRTNGQVIAESTTAVYLQEHGREELKPVRGGWIEVGVMLDMPAGWGPDRAVLLACESDALLLLKLTETFAAWRAGELKGVVDILGT